jgi:TonB family protein
LPPIIAARLPSLAIPAGATEIAITISRSTATTIGEANPLEVANVLRRCGAARRAAATYGVRGPGMTLLVRVEQDGRVTDSRVEVGSGNDRLDESAQSCLREHAVLTPQQLHGVSVASWQRVHWSAS